MGTVYADWCNKNEQRNYPIEDLASKTSVSGATLPDNFLVDANIWIPRSAGDRVYLSSAAITPALVTMTFMAASGSSTVPVAALAVRKPVDRYRKYTLDPYYPGVGGWVAFGSAPEELTNLVLSFSGPTNTPLVPKVTRSYDDLPVSSIGKENKSTALTGIVELRGGDNIEVLACTQVYNGSGDPDYRENPRYRRFIDGRYRSCIVVRMAASSDDYETLYTFAGPCQKAPDSFQCEKRLLRKINGVSADCDGNITIEFENVTAGTVVDGDGDVVGLSVDYPLGLTDVCDPDKGLAMPEIADLCEEEE